MLNVHKGIITTMLYFAGIHHSDSLCRFRLIKWLKHHSESKNTGPAFIAVEASKEIYSKLKFQRNIFRRLAETELHGDLREVLDALTLSIYYEADAYHEAFPYADVIWLDNGRQVSENSLKNYAQDRLNIYKPFFNAKDDVLMQISEWAWSRNWELPPETPLGEPDYSRDFIFFDKIKRAICTHNGNWAIVIVGASHAANRKNSVRVLLENDQIECNVTILKPE